MAGHLTRNPCVRCAARRSGRAISESWRRVSATAIRSASPNTTRSPPARRGSKRECRSKSVPGRSKSVLGHKGRAVRPHCPAECVNGSSMGRQHHSAESDREHTMTGLSRRSGIKATGAAGASLLPLGVAHTEAPAHDLHDSPLTRVASVTSQAAPQIQSATYLFLNSEEAAFVEAAVARLIPADEQWPGAREAGVPNYIDKQLSGAWGAGERLYRGGPWQKGTPSQGYQLPFTPAELFRTAIAAINTELKATGGFAKLGVDEQDAYLHALEGGGKDL